MCYWLVEGAEHHYFFFQNTCTKKGIKQTILIGGRNQSDIIETNEYQKFGKLLITTDDGSCGERGFV